MVITPGAPIFELAVPCEVFGVARPDLAADWYEFVMCAAEPGTTVAGGFVAGEVRDLAELSTADTVIVPACTGVHDRQPPEVVAAVREAHRRGARIASICSGAFLLAEAGLLDGRRATTHWMHAEELARRYPRVLLDARVIYTEDDGVFTSAGTAAGIDLCLELVRRDHGTAVANALARRLVTPPHRGGDQAQYMVSPVAPASVSSLHHVTEWVHRNLARPIRLRDLAARAHLSERQLARRFVAEFGRTPGEWLTRERLRRAQELLEATSLTVDSIAAECGFGTAAGLRAAFAKHLHVSPSRYRAAWAR
ncbi:helix-turn-helix domain-containing protein [Stackebrandtia albiflava]